MDIGKNLKTLRSSYKLSQQDLATILGTTQQHISQFEKNERKLSLSEAAKIMHYFKLPCECLISEQPSVYTFSSTEEYFFYTSANLSSSDQQLILSLIERLART